MIQRSIIFAGIGVFLATGVAWAQNPTLTDNVNNTGIPRQAPSMALPSIYGLNPCATGSAVGVTTPLFGVGGALSDIDRECETRNNAAVVITGLKDEALGREILCEIKDVREAAIRVGKPCLRDYVAPKVAAVEPVAPAQPTAVPPRPVAAASPPTPGPVLASLRPDAPAFCRMKDLEIGLYPDCTTPTAPASTVGPSGVSKSPPKAVSGPTAAKPGATVVAMPGRRPNSSVVQAATHGGAYRADPALLMALEQNLIHLVAQRRMELAEADAQHHPSAPILLYHAPRGPLLASATIEEREADR